MSVYPTLPFPRGQTYGDGQLTLTDTTAKHLEGKRFRVPDTLHGTKGDVVLRVVKNDAGADLTISKRVLKWSTASEDDIGNRVDGWATASVHGKPIDDYYLGRKTTIPDDDLFYVVDEGPCDVLISTTTSTAISAAGKPVQVAAAGCVGQCADNKISIGTALEAKSTAALTAVAIYVHAGIITNYNA